MKDNQLYRNYSMQPLLDNLDVIERFDHPGKRCHYAEITVKQQQLYECFKVDPPGML